IQAHEHGKCERARALPSSSNEVSMKYRWPDHGSTLVAALIVAFVLCVMIAATFELTNGIGRQTQGSGAVESAIAVADGSLDYLYANWRQVARASPNLAPSTSEFSNISAPPMTYFPDMKQCILNNFGLVAVDPLLQPLAEP